MPPLTHLQALVRRIASDPGKTVYRTDHFRVDRANRGLSAIDAVSILKTGAVIDDQGVGDHGGNLVKVSGAVDRRRWQVVAEFVDDPHSPAIHLVTKFPEREGRRRKTK